MAVITFRCPEHGRFFPERLSDEQLDDYLQRIDMLDIAPCPVCGNDCIKCGRKCPHCGTGNIRRNHCNICGFVE